MVCAYYITGSYRVVMLLWHNVKVLPYDYYGSYDHKPHENYAYNELLKKEYTFDWPQTHSQVSCVWNEKYFNNNRCRTLRSPLIYCLYCVDWQGVFSLSVRCGRL